MTFTKTISVDNEHIKNFIEDTVDNMIESLYIWLDDGYNISPEDIKNDEYLYLLEKLRDEIEIRRKKILQ